MKQSVVVPTATSMNSSLSRTSSLASVVSDEGSIASTGSSEIKRTRKRFTNVQLMMLEKLFHETSHPTRQQREKLSRDADLELRSVTVWFQNKRQTERKVALTNATNARSQSPSVSSSNSLPATSRSRKTASHTTRPSLDHIASRSEHRNQPTTPPRKTPSSDGALWESMPSSPVELPSSSPETTRAFVEFGKGSLRRTRTLEWACAAARLADREGRRIAEEHVDEEKNIGMVVDDEGDTEEDEAHEALTPHNSFVHEAPAWDRTSGGNNGGGRMPETKTSKQNHDEETMNAAMVLCGLRQ